MQKNKKIIGSFGKLIQHFGIRVPIECPLCCPSCGVVERWHIKGGCGKCYHREAARKWREDHREQLDAASAARRAATAQKRAAREAKEAPRKAKEAAEREKKRATRREWAKTAKARRKEQERAYRAANADKIREKNRCRKARLRGAEHRPYRDGDIFERDGWICQICFNRVDCAIGRSEPMGATIDHIIPSTPRFQGAPIGPDTPENVRLAHRRCNLRRSNKPPAVFGQLILC